MQPASWWTRRPCFRTSRGATDPIDVDWVSGVCLMTRRDTFERLGGLDESFFMYWEDADYCRRAANAGHRCRYVPSVTVRHATGASALYDPARAISEFHASAYRLYRKHTRLIGRLLTPVAGAVLSLRRQVHIRRLRQRIVSPVSPIIRASPVEAPTTE